MVVTAVMVISVAMVAEAVLRYISRNGDGAIEAFDSDIGYSSICIDCAVLQMSILCSGLTSAVHVVVQCSWNEMCNVYRVSIRRR